METVYEIYHTLISEYSVLSIVLIVLIYIIKKEIGNFYNKIRVKSIEKSKSIIGKEQLSTKEDINVIIRELNRYFHNEVKLHQIFENIEPIIEINEVYNSDFCTAKEIEVKNQIIRQDGFDNEPHALLESYTDLGNTPIVFDAKKTYFSTILCLRDKNIKPNIISAGAVLIDNEKKVLIVHQRSLNSATYPGYYHILGGAFLPKMNNYSTTYDTTLKYTVIREIAEETNSEIEIKNLNDVRYRTFSEELTTGFIQYEFLGATVNIKGNGHGNWEGNLIHIPFSELEDKLIKLNWVPSGKMHILAWLALGAPNSNYFKYNDARKIYHSVIGKA